jgi:chromosome segregation ATPase
MKPIDHPIIEKVFNNTKLKIEDIAKLAVALDFYEKHEGLVWTDQHSKEYKELKEEAELLKGVEGAYNWSCREMDRLKTIIEKLEAQVKELKEQIKVKDRAIYYFQELNIAYDLATEELEDQVNVLKAQVKELEEQLETERQRKMGWIEETQELKEIVENQTKKIIPVKTDYIELLDAQIKLVEANRILRGKLDDKIQNIRKWYGRNQIHIPDSEAIKMIKILGDEE